LVAGGGERKTIQQAPTTSRLCNDKESSKLSQDRLTGRRAITSSGNAM